MSDIYDPVESEPQRHHCDDCSRWKRAAEFPRRDRAAGGVLQPCLTCRTERERRQKREQDRRRRHDARLPMAPMQQLIRQRGGPAAAAREIGVSMETVRQAMRRESIQVGTADHWATELGEPLSLLYPDLY